MRSFLITLAMVIFFTSYSQSGSVSGKIMDSTSKKQMALTTITVYKASDTSIVTYRLSNETGNFRIPGLPLNINLRLVATYSGFLPFRMEFELTSTNPDLVLGTLNLKATTSTLEEVVVFAERPPVIYKNDTIEFNASAFKTLPTALVEDLLKKLPGIEIDAAGNIQMNGRRINRILVDGKRFFGNDPRMATRNLPSDVIDKVQVMDDKEEIALNNDGNMSSIGKVINLTLKKDVKKLMFGKVSGGGGTDKRYDLGGILNSFRDTLQFSLLGFRNNINKSSFSVADVANLGGLGRSGISTVATYNSGGREGFALNGISFGGTNLGINTVTGAGLNINHNPTKRLSFFSQYFYGNTISTIEQQQNTKRVINDTVYNLLSINNMIVNGNTHNAAVGINWQMDPQTNSSFSFDYNSTDNISNSPVSVISENNKLGLLSTTNGLVVNSGKRHSYNHDISVTHRFLKKGRNISISHSLSNTQNPSEITTENTNIFYIPAANTTIFQQLRSMGAPATSMQLNLNYSDPLSNAFTLRINERLSYNKYGRDIATFGIKSGSQTYDSIIAGLTNGLVREQTRWSNGVTLGYKLKKINFNFSPTFLWQWINNGFTNSGFLNMFQQYRNLLINFNANTQKLNLSFTQDVTAPSINLLNPVPDNSNPLFVSFGNPELLPTHRKQFDLSVNLPNAKRNFSFFASANTVFFDNYVQTSVNLNSSGVQTTRPVNVDNMVTSSMNFRVSKQYRSSKNNIVNLEFGSNNTLSKIPVIFNDIRTGSTVLSGSLNARVLFNWHDKVEFSARYSPNFMRTDFETPLFNSTEVITQNLLSEMVIRSLKDIVFETNLNYRQFSIAPLGFPRNNINWNAAITFLMLKNKRAQLKLAIYDILNTNNFVINSVAGNAIVDSRTNVLKRFALATFSYNIRSQKREKKEIGGRQNMFLF